METALKIRRHLTPPMGMRLSSEDLRREVRREVSERVMLRRGQASCEGWTLNISRGGVRVIVEGTIALGQVFDLTVGTASASPLARQGRVVWFQQEADGYIVGFEFVQTTH